MMAVRPPLVGETERERGRWRKRKKLAITFGKGRTVRDGISRPGSFKIGPCKLVEILASRR